jgi:HrpA-like RNA helicase
MVDEVHERTIFIDIILYLLKTRLDQELNASSKPSFKLILTSATMQLEKFRKYFQKYRVKTIEIQSHTPFPIELNYAPNKSTYSTIHHAVTEALKIHTNESDGDILIFLPGSQECLQAMKLLGAKLEELVAQMQDVPGCKIFSLFGTQSVQEQMRVFEPLEDVETTRKIIFATNIAETSLTIANIGYVIDSGLVKLPYYDSKTNGVVLKTVSISKSQAVQRTGRAGRTRPGKSIRLYS